MPEPVKEVVRRILNQRATSTETRSGQVHDTANSREQRGSQCTRFHRFPPVSWIDQVVPFALGERLFAAVRAPKRFFRAAGAHHNDVFASPGLVAAITAFAREATGG